MDHEPPKIDSTTIACIECGYDLSGAAIGGRCPECGHPVLATLRANPLKKPVHPLAVASGGVDHEPPKIDSTTIMCTVCGYDLSGTAIGGRCPECGLPVAQSILVDKPPDPLLVTASGSMVIGVLSLIIVCVPLGILAVLVGWIALNEIKRGRYSRESVVMARLGVILGAFGIVLNLLFFLVNFALRA